MKTIYLQKGRLFLFFLSLSLHLSAQGFITPLPIPPILAGEKVDSMTVYNITMDTTWHQFFPNNAPIPTMSFNNAGFLGPTILWKRGDYVRMNVDNFLGQTTTLHWHGAHVPSYCDGGPHDTIPIDGIWQPEFNILDAATTMWYHPHLHMTTLPQVNMGLAAMIIIRDPADPFDVQLPHTYGVDEFPIILQDRQFLINPQTGLEYIDLDCTLGPTLLVNGIHNPVLHVPAQQVRFRILDGASERAYSVGFSDGTTYQLIATDAGYTAQPYTMTNIPFGPGERNEWVVNFTGRQGDTLYLSNFANKLDLSMPGSPNPNAIPGCYSLTSIDSFPTPMLQIIVDPPTANPIYNIPATFTPLDVPDKNSVDVYRAKSLVAFNSNNNAPPFSIDSLNFQEEYINDTVMLNDIEIWTVINSSGVAHPFHIHDIHFFVLDVNGNPDIPLYLRGPKDVIMVPNGQVFRYITQFTDFATHIQPHDTYMYHCHILSHEDGGMMHQFVVTTPALSGIQERPIQKGPVWDLYPNPANGMLSLRGECSGPSQLRIYNISGVLLETRDLESVSGDYTLPISTLHPGMYQIVWERQEGTFSRKVVVN